MTATTINFNLVSFNEEPNQGVNARELHEQLEVGRDFSNWIKGRIEEAMLKEGNDYSPVLANINGRGQPRKDYVLSIDAAKHIAMLERNEIGRQVRQYFIEIEKRAKEIHNNSTADPLLAALKVSTAIREQQLADSKRIDHLEEIINRDDKNISVIGWVNINKLPRLYKGESSQIGKVLTKLANADGIEIIDIPDARWGKANAYPKEFMEKYFNIAYKQVVGRKVDKR